MASIPGCPKLNPIYLFAICISRKIDFRTNFKPSLYDRKRCEKTKQNFRKIPFCITRNSRINLFMCHIFIYTANRIRSIECWNSWLYKNKSMSLNALKGKTHNKKWHMHIQYRNAFVTKIIRHSQLSVWFKVQLTQKTQTNKTKTICLREKTKTFELYYVTSNQ